MRREAKPGKVNRMLRNVPTKVADGLAAEAASRSMSVNALVVGILEAHVEHRALVGEGDFLDLGLTALLSRLGFDGMEMIRQARELIGWAKSYEQTKRWSPAAAAWVGERERQREKAGEAHLAQQMTQYP